MFLHKALRYRWLYFKLIILNKIIVQISILRQHRGTIITLHQIPRYFARNVPVSYQTDHIQSMISEIDRVLRQTQSRKWWTIFTHHTRHRQLLERCRNFLVMQQRPQSVNLLAAPPAPNSTPNSNQAMATELQQLRQAVMQPLRSDVAVLGNHRAALQEEIQALMLQKAELESECNTYRQNLAQSFSVQPDMMRSSGMSSGMNETELARLQAIRDRTDFLLTSMDSSLQLAFGSMQKNVEVYQTTLHTGLDRMHHLGYQGEVLFSTLVNRLAQQVGREMMTVKLSDDADDRSQSSLNDSPSLNLVNEANLINKVSSPNPHQDWPTDRSSNTIRQLDDLYRTDSRESSTADILPKVSPKVDPIVEPSSIEASSVRDNESIDSFFADFKAFDQPSSDRSLSPKANACHPSDSMSSRKTTPQQVDVTMDLSYSSQKPSQTPQNESNETEIVTLDTLFGFPEEISVDSFSSDMTLAEIDELFADVPSL